LKEIVDRLNDEPFCCDLSLVGFDEKEPYELMECLNKVLIYLDAKHEVDLREEKPEAMYQRMAEFLHILGYQCSYDTEFQHGLLSGDKRTVHPILYWILCNLGQLKKRAYLAKFCMNLELPEEFLREEQVYAVFQSYKELQSQFKATHAHAERERQSRMVPTELQREVVQLDAEREQLSQKIQHLRNRSEKDEGFQMLLKVTSMLRKEQEEEARLCEKLGEQRYQLEATEQLYVERSAKLREMREMQQQDGEGGSADAMLKVLRNDVVKGRAALERVCKEGEEKMQKLREIDAALSDPPVTQQDIAALDQEIGAMQDEIRAMEQTINSSNQDSRLSVYRQQANLVAKKKEAVMKDKKEAEQEHDSLAKELTAKERDYEQSRGHKFMKKEEFKSYAASLRDKSAKFKRLKAELSEARHEVAVLLRTEQILQAKDPTPHGLKETEAMLEKASVEKSQIDKAKGKTLDEISSIVSRINTQLKDKKNKLAPQIKALRSVRQNFQQVEVKYLEKKGAYDQARTAMEGELEKTANDVKQLESEVLEAEKSYHQLSMELCSAEGQLQRAHREARCQRKEERHSKDHQTMAEEYAAQITQYDEHCRELRKEQKIVKETHEDNLKQKRAFVQLEKLIGVKLKIVKQEFQQQQSMMDPRGHQTGISTAGVDRLVID